jgi:hypothetical protein
MYLSQCFVFLWLILHPIVILTYGSMQYIFIPMYNTCRQQQRYGNISHAVNRLLYDNVQRKSENLTQWHKLCLQSDGSHLERILSHFTV